MDREQFEKRFGCIEEFVLTFNPFHGPQVTDLETNKTYKIKEKDFEEILAYFRTVKGPWE